MFCSQCGGQLEENTAFCTGCGAPVGSAPVRQSAEGAAQQGAQRPMQQPQQPMQQGAQQQYAGAGAGQGTRHDVPRCTCCGYIGPWKLAPVVRTVDWIVGGALLLLWGSGLVYLLIVVLVRSNKDNRSKLCPQCGAKNLWTFFY